MSATTMGTPSGPPRLSFRILRGLARGWWMFLLRGIVAILFGLMAFLAPVMGLALLLGLLAGWFVVDGVITIAHAITGRPLPGAGPTPRFGGGTLWLWVDGIISLIAAALLIFQPIASAYALLLVVAAWFLVSGVFRVILAIRSGSLLMGLVGVLGILAGIWLVAAPGPGLLALVWVMAAQAIAAGILLISLAIRLRRVHHDPTPG